MALYKTEGIVLRTRNLGEADRIITLYSPTHGKIEGVARGSRRTRSRLVGATQLFTHGHYMIFSNRRSLDTVSQAEIMDSFSGLREDLTKMAFASYLAELVDVSVELGEPSAPLFQLLYDSFRSLCESEASELVVRRFELRFMVLQGYQPQLECCVRCGQQTPAERFSVKEGGVLCPACVSVDSAALRVTQATVEWLKRLVTAPIDRISVFRPTEGELKLIEAVCRAYVDYRLARPLKSVTFMASIQNLA